MEQKKKGGVLKRAFSIAGQGKGLLLASCVASVVGMVSGILPYLSVFFIAKQLLMPQPGSDTRGVLLL